MNLIRPKRRKFGIQLGSAIFPEGGGWRESPDRSVMVKSVSVEGVGKIMNKNWLGIIGTVLAIAVIVWLMGGSRISCHESFWDKDKQVIEIKTN